MFKLRPQPSEERSSMSQLWTQETDGILPRHYLDWNRGVYHLCLDKDPSDLAAEAQHL